MRTVSNLLMTNPVRTTDLLYVKAAVTLFDGVPVPSGSYRMFCLRRKEKTTGMLRETYSNG